MNWIVGFACASLLAACGQKGALILPKDPAAQNRATLPQVLNPSGLPSTSTSTPASTPTTTPFPAPR